MNARADDQAHMTRLLGAWRDGDADARDRVIAMVYAQVRRLAAHELRRHAGAGPLALQPTELANELFVKLLDGRAGWQDRRHFYNAAALAMRRILIDGARAARSEKRGGDQLHVTLSAAADAALESADAQALEEALHALRELDRRKCEIIEMNCLLGLGRDEIALALDISVPTVDRDLRFARAWLQQRLQD